MFNWNEMEELAMSRHDALNACLTEPERQRIEFLAELAASRKALRARVAAALVRFGARLDPHIVIVHQNDDALVDGHLAAYLR